MRTPPILVDARLDRDDHARLQFGFRGLGHTRALVDIQSDAVPQAVPERPP